MCLDLLCAFVRNKKPPYKPSCLFLKFLFHRKAQRRSGCACHAIHIHQIKKVITMRSSLRNFWRNRTYSFLNIFGLAIGIACAGLIFLWIEDEVNFDSIHTKKANLYQVKVNMKYGEQVTAKLIPAMNTALRLIIIIAKQQVRF